MLRPVIVVAQSGRFLAQHASAAGYPVRVADCFGDKDTLAVAESWQAIAHLDNCAAIAETIIQLSQDEPCYLLYGTGIELFYPVLAALPAHITVLGNSLTSLQSIHSAEFFAGLQRLAIAHPDTRFTLPSQHHGWLSKSLSGFGGHHIQASSTTHNTPLVYYQRKVTGQSGSALFISDGQQARLLTTSASFCRQQVSHPYLLQGLSSMFELTEAHSATLLNYLQLITQQWQLVGINSLDFIIDEQQQLLVLELNPRISASAQLLPYDVPLMLWHQNACHGLLPDTQVKRATTPVHLHTIFSPAQGVIPENVTWPDYCHDLPVSEQVIQQHQVICTAIVETKLAFHLSQQRVESTLFSLFDFA